MSRSARGRASVPGKRTLGPARAAGGREYVWTGAGVAARIARRTKENTVDKPWKAEELQSLVATLRKHSRIGEAVHEHNKVWKTNRTRDSVEKKLRRDGLGGFGNFLRAAAARQDDAPLEVQVKRLVDVLRRKPSADIGELCNELDVSPRRLEKVISTAKAMNIRVEMPTQDRIMLNVKAPPIDRLAVRRLPIEPVKGEIVFAVASDIHFASKLHRGECLTDFIDLAMEQYGVRTVLCPGDVFAGINMYRGQLNEITGWSMQHQLEAGVKGLPRRTGLSYKVIGGNHDESFMKAGGADIIQAFAQARPDVEQYGWYSALIDIEVPGVKRPLKVELHHPDKAGAYALSYHLQKEIEQMPPGTKPHLLFAGHTHTTVCLPYYRGVAAFYCGTFEDQTLFLKRKHLDPSIGGWIVRVGVAGDGALKTLSTTFVRYFHSARGGIVGTNGETGESVRLERRLGLG